MAYAYNYSVLTSVQALLWGEVYNIILIIIIIITIIIMIITSLIKIIYIIR